MTASITTSGRPAASTTFDAVALPALVKDELPDGAYVGRDLDPPWTVPEHIAKKLESIRPDEDEVTIIRVLALTFPRALAEAYDEEQYDFNWAAIGEKYDDDYGYALKLVDRGYLSLCEVAEACAGPHAIVWIDDYG